MLFSSHDEFGGQFGQERLRLSGLFSNYLVHTLTYDQLLSFNERLNGHVLI